MVDEDAVGDGCGDGALAGAGGAGGPEGGEELGVEGIPVDLDGGVKLEERERGREREREKKKKRKRLMSEKKKRASRKQKKTRDRKIGKNKLLLTVKFSDCAVSHSPALNTLKCAVLSSEWKSDRNRCSRSSRAFSEGADLSSLEGRAFPVPARLKYSKSRLTRPRMAEKSWVAVASMAAVTRSKSSEDCGVEPTAAGKW